VIRAVVVVVTDVAGAVIAVTNVAGQIVAAATIAVIGAVMLLTDVSDGIVAPVTGLSDCGNCERANGGDRDHCFDIARFHEVPPFPGMVVGTQGCLAPGPKLNWTFVARFHPRP
jgi:hypothetical protein